jgi:aminoglycoside/choline kinase family phosphotransferase
MLAAVPLESLARAVREAFGERADIVAVEPLAGDASSRRYVRLRLRGVAAPPTVVAMLLGTEQRFGPGGDEAGGPADDELPFVAVGRWLATRGLPVPAIHGGHAARDRLLLVEDVGDTALWAAATRDPSAAPALFASAVDLLAALQTAGARHPDRSCRAFRHRFDEALARWELEHFVEHGIETRHGKRLADRERAALLDALAPLVTPFAAADPVLVHRDFMAWNIHVQDGDLRLIDFQDALLGPDAYDLAALLTDRTTSDIVVPALETELIARFAAARAAAGLPVPGDLSARYRACALHRALKVIGRFHFLELVLGKPGYLAYLPAVYAVARRMFAAMPGLEHARGRIGKWVPELAAAL